MTLFSQFIYRFHTVPIKIPDDFFIGIDRQILKFIWKCRKLRRANTILRRTNVEICCCLTARFIKLSR